MTFCDVESATADYATRFKGALGAWFLKVQAEALEHCMLRCCGKLDPSLSVLDIGGGHAQVLAALVAWGIHPTLLASSIDAVGMAQRLVDEKKVDLVVGAPLTLPFADKSFDVVTTFRILPHTDAWEMLIQEMCRVARRAVIVDYPSTKSINVISDHLFGLKKNIEKNTRPYKLFSPQDIREQFSHHNFSTQASVGQYVMPMALYRAFPLPSVAAFIEFVLKNVGFRSYASPIVEGFVCR